MKDIILKELKLKLKEGNLKLIGAIIAFQHKKDKNLFGTSMVYSEHRVLLSLLEEAEIQKKANEKYKELLADATFKAMTNANLKNNKKTEISMVG